MKLVKALIKVLIIIILAVFVKALIMPDVPFGYIVAFLYLMLAFISFVTQSSSKEEQKDNSKTR